jgi:hypothetical protein
LAVPDDLAIGLLIGEIRSVSPENFERDPARAKDGNVSVHL